MGETNRGIDISMDNSGTLFPVKGSTDYEGAIKVDEVTYDVKMTLRQSKQGKDYFGVEGTGRGNDGKSVTGAMFPKTSTMGTTGNAKPSWTGDITMAPGGEKLDLAAWDKNGQKPPHNAYLSLKVSVPRPKAEA